MARDSEMKAFTRGLFRGQSDLSTLTHSIVRQRFLAHVGRDHLEPEEKQALKRLVEQELLKMQVDEAGTGEKLEPKKKVKRSPTSSSDPERKRFRFNSESGLSSSSSSPDRASSPAKNGVAAAEFSPSAKSARQTPKQAVESMAEEEQQRALTAQVELEEGAEENSEEEEEFRARPRKRMVAKNKPTPGKTAARKRQARKESKDNEEEPAQRMRRKAKGQKGAKSHRESETDSEEDEDKETPAKKKESREEGDEGREECANRMSPSSGHQRPAGKGSCKQNSRAGRLSREQQAQGGKGKSEATSSGDSTGGEETLSGQRKCRDEIQPNAGRRGSSSEEEEVEDSERGVEFKCRGTPKVAKLDSRSEESDLEREVSGSEADGSPKGEKTHSSKKSCKQGRVRSVSTSSEDSPGPRGQKTVSDRRGEDHPAVTRLKRYIRACGAYRNYKKLLGSCRSHKERLGVLRAELEALGMKGNPTMEKCRALKEQREEAAEVAALDMANIISSSGRSRRRTAWNPLGERAPSEIYRRTLDSEEERPHPPPPDWSHMHGIISSDGDST